MENSKDWLDGPWPKPADLHAKNARANESNTFVLNLVQGAQLVEAFMRRTGAKLGGSYVNSNTGFAMGQPPTVEKAFIIGDFIVIDPSSTVRFDESMCLKEDYDFSASHIATYGRVCRMRAFWISCKSETLVHVPRSPQWLHSSTETEVSNWRA